LGAVKQATYRKYHACAVNLRRIDKGGVLASFDLWFVELGLKLYGWLWGRRPGGQEWIMPPARDWTDKNGATRHAKILGFTNDRAERGFKQRCLGGALEMSDVRGVAFEVEQYFDKIAKVLGMAGGSEGEATAAIRAADRLIRDVGLTWPGLLKPFRELEVATDAARHLLGENETLRAEVDRLRAANGHSPAAWHDVGAVADTDARRRAAAWALDLHGRGQAWLGAGEIHFLAETIPAWPEATGMVRQNSRPDPRPQRTATPVTRDQAAKSGGITGFFNRPQGLRSSFHQ
jgi:hypothetical protein